MRLCGLALALLDLLLQRLSVWRRIGGGGSWATYQGSHGAVKSMSVVASELGVGTLERRVSVGLGLLDTVRVVVSVASFSSVWSMAKWVVVVSRREYRCVPVLVGLLGLVVLRRVLGLCRILSAFHQQVYQHAVATYWPLRRLEVNNLSRLLDLQGSHTEVAQFCAHG